MNYRRPPPPDRSFSASTANSSSFRERERSSSPRSEVTPSSPVSSRKMDLFSRGNGWDELDKLGYTFSLKVAVLHQHLSQPRTSTISTLAPSPLASPGIQGTSPSGSRFTLSFGGGSPKSEFDPTAVPSSPVPPVIGRRKSSFGLNKKKDDVLKLPKEFLLEFWTTLADDAGDAAWKEAVGSFLGNIRKGTKTPSGLNLRQIPVLLECFTQAIPPSAPSHRHQSHFLQLLNNSLPRSSYFSPIARSQSDKDRELLARLRTEISSYMLDSSPNPTEDLVSAGFHSPAPRSSPGLSQTTSRQSGTSQVSGVSEIKRKPSPLWLGDEMLDTVGMVWDVGKDGLERDAEETKRAGKLEQLYYNDLRNSMSFLSSMSSLTPSQRSRHQSSSDQLSSLLQSFPELEHSPDPLSLSNPFFTPPRQNEVFARLAARASEVGLGAKTRDLVEKCRSIWGIESRHEKEKEAEQLIERWSEAVGTQDEIGWGRQLADCVRILTSTSNDFPKSLDELLSRLLEMLGKAAGKLFPTSSLPPDRPPPSLLPILNAGGEVFFQQPRFQKSVEDLSDEIKGLAVQEYVVAAEQLGGMGGSTGGDSPERFENVGGWIEREIRNVQASWGSSLGPMFNPAAIILSRQFPLFCAELQALAQPSGSDNMFKLYEITGRLTVIWEELCPGQEHGFDLDPFFEPHVQAWLKTTEANTTQEWVSRAVGMDSWVPEGENKHSQSVVDLFEFIREAAQVVLNDLPLSEYRRAVYLIDLSKTVSIATTQYASTVSALFGADMNPAKPGSPAGEIGNKFEAKLGGKASSWLAKGQQAVKALEKKKVDGFVIPPAACVKLTDMGAAQMCLEDLVFALEADETARIVKQHKLSGPPERTRHVFTVTVLRGEGILTKGLTKGADGFVVVTDRETGERLVKTRTVLGQEDPRWEQSFEISVGRVKTLELAVFDRTLVGKHDPIGTSSFRLDPRSFTDVATRDVLLPLNPRGAVHVRISMEGGEKHDVAYHLSTGSRALSRTADDMIRDIVDKLGEFIKATLSPAVVLALTKPLKDKKKARGALCEEDVERSLGPVFEYLNENFGVFNVTLTHNTRVDLMTSLWHRIIEILISLLVPPLSDRPYTKEVLGSAEIDVIFKWLNLLKGFFNAAEGGYEHGVPIGQLQSGNYKDLIMLGQYMDLPTAALKERCSAAVKSASARVTPAGGLMGGMGGLNLGNVLDNERMAEVLLRIARTRPNMDEFLVQQIATLTRARTDRQAEVL